MRNLQHYSWALLPAGNINLNTGNTKYFNVFENGEFSIVLIKRLTETGFKYIACSTYGDYKDFQEEKPIGSNVTTYNNPNRKNFNNKIIGYFHGTKDGLQEIKNLVGKTSISFSVFK